MRRPSRRERAPPVLRPRQDALRRRRILLTTPSAIATSSYSSEGAAAIISTSLARISVDPAGHFVSGKMP
jgi:hypothetical protein